MALAVTLALKLDLYDVKLHPALLNVLVGSYLRCDAQTIPRLGVGAETMVAKFETSSCLRHQDSPLGGW